MEFKVENLMKNLKIQALADFLDCTPEEICQSYSEGYFEFEKEEYRVLTDGEAHDAARDSILDTLWAFKGSFIQAHSNLSDKAVKALGKACGELCEDANDLVKGVIKDLDHFVTDAIKADGRGHFLSSYDGKENTEKVEGVQFFIYRQN